MNKLFLAGTLAFAAVCQAQSNTPNPPSKEAEAEYANKIAARTLDITKVLAVTDTAKSNHVFSTIVAHYRTLRDWHDFNDAKVKALTKSGTDEDKATLQKIVESRKTLHEKFLTELATDLTPEQVDKVKDKMTYNKVQVTYNAYLEIIPTLTDAQKAHILEVLKEAREEAMDGGSSDEKSAIFKKYKGRIANYLSKEGVDETKARKEWAAKQKPKKEGEKEESKPAEAPKPVTEAAPAK